MKYLILSFLGVALCWPQQIDYNTQIKNTPTLVYTTATTLTSQCSKAHTAKKSLVLTSTATVSTNTSLTCDIIIQGGTIKPAAGVTVTLNGSISAGRVSWIDLSNGSNAIVNLKPNCCLRIYPEWWGAVHDWDGTTGTNDSGALNNAFAQALAVNITVELACSQYYVTSPVTISSVVSPVHVTGCYAAEQSGVWYGSWIIGAAGGMIVDFTNNLELDHFGIYAIATADALAITGNTGFTNIHDMWFGSSVTGKSLISGIPGANQFDQINLQNNNYFNLTQYTVPQVWFHTDGGFLTPGTITGGVTTQVICNKLATAPFFKIDGGGNNGSNDWRINDILAENCSAGLIDLEGILIASLTRIDNADPDPVTAPSIKFGFKAGSNARISWITMKDLNVISNSATDDYTTPDILADVTGMAGGTFVAQIEGGRFGYARIKGNSFGATYLVKNVLYLGQKDITDISTGSSIQLGSFALRQGTITGKHTFGTDPNQINDVNPGSADCFSGTDLAVNSSDPNIVSSAGLGSPVKYDIYSYLDVYSGTGGYIGKHEIIGVSGSNIILRTAAGATSSSGLVFSIGRDTLSFTHDRAGISDRQDYIGTCIARGDSTIQKVRINTTLKGTFAQRPGGVLGEEFIFTDSNTTTWGATIAGSGGSTVKGWYNGSNWTVVGE